MDLLVFSRYSHVRAEQIQVLLSLSINTYVVAVAGSLDKVIAKQVNIVSV